MLSHWHSHTMQALANRGEPDPAANEVWYDAPSQITPYTSTGITAHTFSDGRGVIAFSAAISHLSTVFRATPITACYLPATATGIGSNAFRGCSSMRSCALPTDLRTVSNSAFYGCTVLELDSIPAGVTNLEGACFYGCTGLTYITFLGTPTSIGATAFQRCANLATIRVPWAEGAVSGAPWGAPSTTQIIYNYTPQ